MATAKIDWKERLDARLAAALPWIVTTWFVGVFALAVRQFGGWIMLRRLCGAGAEPADEVLAGKLRNIAQRLGVQRAVRLLCSVNVAVPSAIGHLKPVILLPASLLSGLSTQQIEALLAHELAHIRRHDYLVNLVQSTCETLLFYHPAVWWLSCEIRREREHCCDDLAVQVCGDRIAYARTLATLEERRFTVVTAAMAATGGSLMHRIRRIVGQPAARNAPRGTWLPGLLVLPLCLAVPVIINGAARQNTNEKTAPVTTGQYETNSPNPDLEHLKGEWEIVSLEGDGNFQWQTRKVGNRIHIQNVGLQSYTFYPLKNPKEVDVMFWLDDLFVTQHGLYQPEGDKLTLCMAPYQDERPKRFAAVPGKSTLFVLKRVAERSANSASNAVVENPAPVYDNKGTPAVEANDPGTALETQWSPPNEGVSLRIAAAKRTWAAGEVPALKWAATNSGTRGFLRLTDGQRRTQLEVDGIWYWWSPRLSPTSRLIDLSSGSAIQDQLVTLGPVWSQAKEEDLLWRRDSARGFSSSERDVPLLLTPGKHTVRIAQVVSPSRAGTGDGFRIISLPLEIFIEAPPSNQAMNWPPSAEVIESAKRAAFAVPATSRPNDPDYSGRLESAVRQATETATLSAGTPLHDPAKSLLDALAELRKAQPADPATATEYFSAVSRAYRQLLGVLSGETPTTPGATQSDTDWGKPVNGLQCRLLPATQKAAPSTGGQRDTSVYVIFELRNITSKPVRFLVQYTPLQEIAASSSVLNVVDHEGNRVRFMAAERSLVRPTTNHFVTVKPGQTISNRIAVPYDFTRPGPYRISSTQWHLDPGTSQAYYADDETKVAQNPDNVWTGKLESNEIEVEIVPTAQISPGRTNAAATPTSQSKFAIYLVLGHTNAPHFRSAERGRIIFSDAGNGADRFDAMRPEDYPVEGLILAREPLLTDADLLAYDRQRNTMHLKSGVLDRLPKPSVWGVPFAVVAEGNPLFLGAFWTGASSYSANMPTISLDRWARSLPADDPDYLPPNAVRLENRQALRDGELSRDPRQDERLYRALQEAGKLVSPTKVNILATTARGAIHTSATAALVSATASSNNAADPRAQALSLLKRHDDYRAELQSYACVEETTSDYQTRLSGPKWAGINGNSKKSYRTVYRTDGTRYSVAMSYWGNIDSPRVFVPEARLRTQYSLWDGKELFANLIDTRLNQPDGLEKMQLPESWELIGRNILEPAKDPAKADKLSVRARLETVGQSRCYVIDSEAKYTDPPHHYVVQETRWLDPDRGYNIVKATRVRKDETGFSDSTTLDNIVCKQIDGFWVPMDASRRKSQAFPNGDYMRITSRIKMTTFALNPDHLALRSFVPHLSNGQRIALNPQTGQGHTIEQTPIWQDGRLLNSQGIVLLDCTSNIDIVREAPLR